MNKKEKKKTRMLLTYNFKIFINEIWQILGGNVTSIDISTQSGHVNFIVSPTRSDGWLNEGLANLIGSVQFFPVISRQHDDVRASFNFAINKFLLITA